MKKITCLVVPLLLVMALTLGGCGATSRDSDVYTTPDVTMGQVDFNHHKLTITAGTTVNFITEPSGATHLLCIGENGVCQSGAQGPAQLAAQNGLTVEPGQTCQVQFDTAGTYKIACTVHPSMNMTITVQ
jgi:plastocyanin